MSKHIPSIGFIIAAALAERGVTQEEFAEHIDTSRLTVNQLCLNKRAITVEMALKLSRSIGETPEHWLELQAKSDLQKALANKRFSKGLCKIKRLKKL